MIYSGLINPAGAMATAGAAQSEADAAAIKRAGLKRACQMFEAHFLQMMWKEMRKTIPKTGLISGGHAEEVFTDMMDQKVAEASSQGRSMGLASMLERQLSREKVTRLPSVEERRMRGSELAPKANFFRGRIVYPQAEAAGGAAAVQQRAASEETTTRATAPAVTAPAPASGGQSEQTGAAATSDTAAGLVSPLRGRITSLFGMRTHPISGKLVHHDGVDVAAPTGTTIKSAAAGKVAYAGWADGYGNLVEVEHADGRTTRYGHCQSLKVKAGQTVKAGQAIATVGSTGNSTGPHLHFEVISAGGRAVDPMKMVALGNDPYA